MARESGDLKVTGARRDRKPPMLRAAISGFLLALLASPGLGQAYVRVSGSILDPSDAILSGATVNLAAGDQDLVRTNTDSHRTFHFDTVKPGRYELRAEYAAGFKPGHIRMNLKTAADENPVRFVLAIADLHKTVSVDAKEGLTFSSTAEKEEDARLKKLFGLAFALLLALSLVGGATTGKAEEQGQSSTSPSAIRSSRASASLRAREARASNGNTIKVIFLGQIDVADREAEGKGNFEHRTASSTLLD